MNSFIYATWGNLHNNEFRHQQSHKQQQNRVQIMKQWKWFKVTASTV